MINGHYIAYVLVDPDVMFSASARPSGIEHEALKGMQDLSVQSSPGGASAASAEASHATPGPDGKKDRRVWCYCSE